MLLNWILLGVVILIFRFYGYFMIAAFFRLVSHTYFRRIDVAGINNLPHEGPAIICSNHPNMFVDAILVLSTCANHGIAPYVWAKAALFQNPILSMILKFLGAVPVFRPPKKNSLEDKDSNLTSEELAKASKKMFEKSWDVLIDKNILVLFPEGTSYTKSHMLNLRTGVMRLACGFVKTYNQSIPIIPCGLTYFKKDKFRSEVLVEFGIPMNLEPPMICTKEFKDNEKEEIKNLTNVLQDHMKNVTLNAPNFEALHLARMLRKLYLDIGTVLSATEEVQFTRNIVGLIELASAPDAKDYNDMEELKTKVMEYQKQLDNSCISDADLVVPSSEESITSIIIERIIYLIILIPFGLPGLILNSPFYILGRYLNVAAGYTESKSMMKILAAVMLMPIQWLFLILISLWYFGSTTAELLVICLPLLLYSHIRVLEEGQSALHTIKSLFQISTRQDRLKKLREIRSSLATDVKKFLDQKLQLKFNTKNRLNEKDSKRVSLRYRQISRSDLSLT